MIAFLNLAPFELLVIAAVAVIVFGKRLPEAAAQAYGQIVKLRHSLESLRRQSGIDREMRNIEYEVRDAARRASLEAPPEERAARENADEAVSEEGEGVAEPPTAVPDERSDRREPGAG